MKIQLSDHFTARKLIRFVFPSIIMMLFTSFYVVIDGFFISNFSTKTAFAAANLIYPFVAVLSCPCYMIAAGGSALVGRTLGEGEPEKARSYFSLLVYFTAALGIALTVLGMVLLAPVSAALGAEGEMLRGCMIYGGILILAQTFYMLQIVFQGFLIVAERPDLNLYVTIGAGGTNVVMDFLLVGVLGWGAAGAAIATALSQLAGTAVPLVFFLQKGRHTIRLGKAKFNAYALWKTCTNGISELLTNISSSIVMMLYNIQLMRLTGPDGISAYGVIMYVSFIFLALFYGYSAGIAPVISYHFGAGNHSELKNLFSKSILLLGGCGIVLTVLAEVFSRPLSVLFVGYDAGLLELTQHGFRVYSVSFLMTGINSFASCFFTALNDGLVSGILSFLRTLVFQTLIILLLPLVFGLDGVWAAIIVAELLSLFVTCWFFIRKRHVYHYL